MLILLLALAYVSLELALYLPKLFAGIRRGSYWALFGVRLRDTRSARTRCDDMGGTSHRPRVRPSLEIIGLTEETMELTGAAALLLGCILVNPAVPQQRPVDATERGGVLHGLRTADRLR